MSRSRIIPGSCDNPEELHKGSRVIRLHGYIDAGVTQLDAVPTILKEIIQKGIWRRWYLRAGSKWVEHDTFAEFVAYQRPYGLGESIEKLRALCKWDQEALDLLDRANESRQGERSDFFDNIQEVRGEVGAPTGTSPEAALRRLRKDRPDLHAQVLAGELSPHGAMVEAGFRPKKVQIPLDNLERAAKTLVRRLGSDAAVELIGLLLSEVAQ